MGPASPAADTAIETGENPHPGDVDFVSSHANGTKINQHHVSPTTVTTVTTYYMQSWPAGAPAAWWSLCRAPVVSRALERRSPGHQVLFQEPILHKLLDTISVQDVN